MIDLERVVSPFNILQEQQIGRPFGVWRILVVCQLLNRTHGRQVRPMIDEFFTRWPSPLMLTHANAAEVKGLIKPLGFSDQRQRSLREMSAQYLTMYQCDPQFWRSYEDGSWCQMLIGCGKYAELSLNVIVYGLLDQPTGDKWLEQYRLWRIELKDLRLRGLM